MFALFNDNKKFIGYAPHIENNSFLCAYYKEIPKEYSNLAEWHWEGDYDTGGMVSNKKIIELNEQQKVVQKILKKYSIATQMLNITKQLYILSKNANLFDNDFKEMSKDIFDILSENNK